MLDTRGHLVSVNQAWRRFADANGLQGPPYAIGCDYLAVCDSAARQAGVPEAAAVATGLRAVLQGRQPSFSMEYPCHSPTEQRWFQLTATPLSDHSPLGAVLMHLNISEQKRAREALRESERRFSDMLANVQLAAVMLDAEARITYCNDYLLRLTGWERGDVIGRDWFDTFMPPDLGDIRPVFAAMMRNQPEALYREQEIYTRSGQRRLLRWNNSVLRSGQGAVIGVASIGEDITEQKLAELAIRRLNRLY